jgi:hypothetical protein
MVGNFASTTHPALPFWQLINYHVIDYPATVRGLESTNLGRCYMLPSQLLQTLVLQQMSSSRLVPSDFRLKHRAQPYHARPVIYTQLGGSSWQASPKSASIVGTSNSSIYKEEYNITIAIGNYHICALPRISKDGHLLRQRRAPRSFPRRLLDAWTRAHC